MNESPSRSFPVLDVTEWGAEDSEDMGARDKLWITDPNEPRTSSLWKQARATGLPEYGSDSCSERIAAEIAGLLLVEAVSVDLAVRLDVRGVVTTRIPGTLRHGNELLSDLNPNYQAGSKGTVAGYDVACIQEVLSEYKGWRSGLSAFDCFVGLLVFDAAIGNTDRHHENWAVVEETRRLTPSFDHGASLGFNASPRQMASVERYSKKALARHFGGVGSLSELAWVGLDTVSASVRDLWLGRVRLLDPAAVTSIVSAVPAGWMSEVRRTFVVELLIENRRRLLR